MSPGQDFAEEAVAAIEAGEAGTRTPLDYANERIQELTKQLATANDSLEKALELQGRLMLEIAVMRTEYRGLALDLFVLASKSGEQK